MPEYSLDGAVAVNCDSPVFVRLNMHSIPFRREFRKRLIE